VHRAMGRGNRFAAIWALDVLEAVGMVDVEGTPRDEDPSAVRIYRLRGEWRDAAEGVYASVGCSPTSLQRLSLS
jgi:hypothetical protein